MERITARGGFFSFQFADCRDSQRCLVASVFVCLTPLTARRLIAATDSPASLERATTRLVWHRLGHRDRLRTAFGKIARWKQVHV
jgi:hypothetical protein